MYQIYFLWGGCDYRVNLAASRHQTWTDIGLCTPFDYPAVPIGLIRLSKQLLHPYYSINS
jgi:hypothetical protein